MKLEFSLVSVFLFIDHKTFERKVLKETSQ